MHTHPQTLSYLSIDQLLLPGPVQLKVENLQPQNRKTPIIVFLSPFLFSSFCLSLYLCLHSFSFFLFSSLRPFFSVKCENCCCLLDNSCLNPLRPHSCSPPGSSVHEILWARILERVATPSSRGSSGHRDRTWVSHITGRIFFFF